MKWSEAKKEMTAEAARRKITQNHPGTFCFVPTTKNDALIYNQESIKLASGECPACGHSVVAEIDYHRGKIFYECVDFPMVHFWIRDAMQ